MKEVVTVDTLQKYFPTKKNAITEEVVDIINKSIFEPEFQGESLLQTAITYDSVLKNNKVSIKEYINAIRFCAYLISLDDNFTEAYKRTFADRKFVQDRWNAPSQDTRYRELTSAASRYRKSKLVVDILTLSQVPLDILFTGARHKALGILANLMETATLDRDKINAAKELLAATKNENVKIGLEIGPSQSAIDMQEQLHAQLAVLAANQKKLLESGLSIKDVQKTGINLNIVEGEVVE